jgi:sugar/nucleoside kinase (ribokinase family)
MLAGKTTDVVVVGELNMDLIMNGLHAFPQVGKEIIAASMELTLGSSSAIFASNLSSLGSRVEFVGKIGQDLFGRMTLESLQRQNVGTEMIIEVPSLRTGATVVLNFDNDRANVTHPGAMEQLQISDLPVEKFASARHLHVASCFLQKGLKKDLASLFRKVKEFGLTTSLDPQWDPAENWDLNLEEILPFTDVFLPNEGELLNLTKQDNVESALKMLGGYKCIIAVKLGSQGSIISSPAGRCAMPAFLNERVVDAIGAGDSFDAAFIHEFIRESDLETCQRFANLVAAISTTAPGGTGAFDNIHYKIENAATLYGFH